MDKDEGKMTDDYIGEFETTISAGAKEAEINGPMLRRNRGHFWLKVSIFHHTVFFLFLSHPFNLDRVYASIGPRTSAEIPIPIRWSHSLFSSFLPYRRSPHQLG
jgi:hypothetical protein